MKLKPVALALSIVVCGSTWAEPPSGYYVALDPTNSETLRASLHAVIDDHTWYPYTSADTDTWDIINLADEDPQNAANIIDIYKNASYPKIPGGIGDYNREHSWPNSFGFPDNQSGNYPYTDVHHLFASDASYNLSRSNKPFRYCNSECLEQATLETNGQGGGVGVYPGNSNWTTGMRETGTWETWSKRQGDVARALMYMDVRYEGGTHSITAHAEPDLILTDNPALITTSDGNSDVGYMGLLTDLLDWHDQDQVSIDEQYRNDVVYEFQGNRNPFIDYPELAQCVFLGSCDHLKCSGQDVSLIGIKYVAVSPACSATGSLKVGSVTVAAGADVTYAAPVVTLTAGFTVESGGALRIINP